MIELHIKDISFEPGGKYIISWDLNGNISPNPPLLPGKKDDNVDLFERKDICINYGFESARIPFFPINIALASLLPPLIERYRSVKVHAPFVFEDLTISYWNTYMREILHSDKFNLSFNSTRNIESGLKCLRQKDSHGIGLLFGGGIESMFALSTMYHKKPILISVIGEGYMNNDKKMGNIKFKLEDKLCEKYELDIQRVDINLRPIWRFGDEYMNQYITGALFYFLTLPIAEYFHINTIYHSMEYEYAMISGDWDLSLNPRFSKNLYIKDKHFPILFSIYNAFPKITMLHELAKTDFVKYIYSCFKNEGKRWCGNCSKCFRISEYCERIGLNRKTIGMQEGIVGLREKSSLAKNYWQIMDKIYKRRYLRELKLAFNYYLKNKLLK